MMHLQEAVNSKVCVYQDSSLNSIELPWFKELSTEELFAAVASYGSPVHIVDPSVAVRNARSLLNEAQKHLANSRVCVALKAAQGRCFIQALKDAEDIAFDVANEDEYNLCIEHGVVAERIVITKPFKSSEFCEKALQAGATLVADSIEELELITGNRFFKGGVTPLLIRVGGFSSLSNKSRFGISVETLCDYLFSIQASGKRDLFRGLQFHLTGYSVADRVAAADELIGVITRFQHLFTNPIIDIGGGIPVNYLADKRSWDDFLQSLRSAPSFVESEMFNGRSDARSFLANHYPFSGTVVSEVFVSAVLTSVVGGGETLAERLRRHGILFQIEPGRSVFYSAGVTASLVTGSKRDAKGRELLGLAMNHMQLRTSSYDYVVEPWHFSRESAPNRETFSGFLVGECCLEHDVIMRRKVTFTKKPKAGDLIIFPSTAGYFSNLYQSPGHRFSLPQVITKEEAKEFVI